MSPSYRYEGESGGPWWIWPAFVVALFAVAFALQLLLALAHAIAS